jgi:DNA replication protein DnaC
MKIDEVVDTLKILKLPSMARVLEEQLSLFPTQTVSADECIGMMVEAERHDRSQRTFSTILKNARFKHNAHPEDIDFSRGLDRHQIDSLLDCRYIAHHQNIAITGGTGSGKSWLACAFGHQAARKGFSVRYTRLSRLLEEFDTARQDRELSKLRKKLVRTDLLIVDHWGIAPLSPIGCYDFLETLEDRSNSGATIIVSPLPIDQWYAYLGASSITEMILERLVRSVHRIEIKDDPTRKQHGLPAATSKEA